MQANYCAMPNTELESSCLERDAGLEAREVQAQIEAAPPWLAAFLLRHTASFGGLCGEGESPAGSCTRSSNPTQSATHVWKRVRQVLELVVQEPIMANALTPVSSNPEYMGGPLLVYEATDRSLIKANLVEAPDLPAHRPGCKNKRSTQRRNCNEFLATYRMPDGRVRLTISASLVRQHDDAFVSFLATTNAAAQVAMREGSHA